MNMDRKLKKCLYSGEEFLPKRNNQVFANKKNRISYHNDISNKIRAKLKTTTKHLTLNHKICIELLNKESSIVIHKEYLKGKGFDFRFMTNMIESKANAGYAYVIYDCSFEKIDDNNYLISKL